MNNNIPLVILFFDGNCNLCNHWVQFVLKYDKKAVFTFSALNSKTARIHLSPFAQRLEGVDSIVLWYNQKIYLKSNAVLKIAYLTGGWRRMALAGYIFPRFIRDFIYDYIARHRIRWFGRTETCWVMKPEWENRFAV